ncbi:MAG: hypothetical protein K2M76_02945, partial [Muribaculaceae bacterium]|nr:hypothetical protein [Muribaculaceae bacterium]
MSQIDLDTLRQSWQNMKIEVDRVSEQNRRLTERIFSNQAKSVRDYVMRRYRMLCIIGIVYTPLMPLLFSHQLHLDLVSLILITLFFPISVVINGSVLYKCSKIHPAEMTVKEMLIAFTNLKIHRSRCRIFGYILVIPILVLLLYHMYWIDSSMFYAGCLGGVIG